MRQSFSWGAVSPANRILLAFALALLGILATRGPLSWGDDAMYLQAMKDRSLADYLSERYRTWSGRTLIDAVTLLLLQQVWVWRLLTLACLLVVVRFMARYVRGEGQPQLLIFICCGLFLVHREVLRDSVWWMTGSFNYLWPFAAGLVALMPFLETPSRVRGFVWCVPAALYAGSQEQMGLLVLGFQSLLVYRLYHDRQLRWGHGLLMLVVLLAFLVVLLAPGTQSRYEVVTRYWFPEYADWTVGERVIAGLDLAFGHIFHQRNLLGCLLVLLLALLVFRRSTSWAVRALAIVPVVVQFAPRMLVPLAESVSGEEHFLVRMWGYQTPPGGGGYAAHGLGNFATALDPAFYVHFFLVMCGTLCMAASLYNAGVRARYGSRLSVVVVFAAAVASGAVIGMSPTLYASGPRVFFFQDMLMLMLTALVFASMPTEVMRRRLLVAVWVLVLVAVWTTVKHLLKY